MEFSKWEIMRVKIAMMVLPKRFRPAFAEMIASSIIKSSIAQFIAESLKDEKVKK